MRALVATLLLVIALVVPPFGTRPATAAPPVVRVTLTQSSADSAIGTDLTLTATVALSGGSAESPAGWYVVFTGTADGGWSSGPVPTAAGVATYDRTSPVPQTETITARLATPDCSAESSTLTHEWWEPEITLNEENAVTPVGTEFELTGFVTRGSDSVPDAAVRVTVINIAPDPDDPDDSAVVRDETVLDTTTADAGEFAVTLPGRPASIDKITVTATAAGGFSARTVTAHSWSDADSETESLTLTAAGEARVADPLVATAEFQPAGAAAGIMFLTDQGWLAPNLESPDGQARYDYAGQSAAGWAGLGVRTSPTGLHRARIAYWWQPVITFVAPYSHSASGESYPATVIVADRGRPVPGMYLAFTVRGDEGPYAYATTNDAGIASAPITGQAGELPIDVEETAGESAPPLPPLHTPATGSTTHTWVSPPPRVDVDVTLTRLDSEDSESRVGTRVPFVARVTSGGEPLQGWDVSFDIDGEDLGTAVSDALGEAVITASRSTESDSVIEATVVITGCTGRWTGSVSHYWWETSLDLNPKAITSPARRDVPFTADLARTVPGEDFGGDSVGSAGDAGGPGDISAAAIPPGMIGLAGQPIRFTMSSQRCDLPVVVREATTDDLGSATVTLSRDGPSIDTVRAEEVGVFDPAAATTSHTWGTPDPVPLSITLDQSSEESRAGTAVTVTATVRDVGRPGGLARAGTPVTFLGVTPSRTVVTDDRGVARLTFAGTGTSPVSVSATAPFGCGLVQSPPVTHRWFVPTLELSPTNATSTTGDTATVTARLSNGGAPVASQAIELTIDSSTAGESTDKITRSTGTDGAAEFSWVRTTPGTDHLAAVEVIAVLPQRDLATHIWEAPPVTPQPQTPTPSTPPPSTQAPSTQAPSTQPPSTQPPAVITETPVTEEPSPDESSEPAESPSPPPPSTPPAPPATQPPSDLPATSTMVDGPEVGRPGADIEMSGTGCRAGETLSVSLGETELGTTRAAADGTFYLRAVVPDLPLGRYVIHSTCGHTIGDPNVDITSPQVDKAGAAIAAVAVTTASTFIFFLLIAKGIISFLPRRPM